VGTSEYLIAGAGIIGLSLALELERRGTSVTVIDAGHAMRQTSSAAAGMLAVNDPANPPALRPLSEFSARLYPEFLDRLAALSGIRVPFQTTVTLEAGEPEGALGEARVIIPGLQPGEHHWHMLDERSVDPRQLAEALLGAVRATRIRLLEQTTLERIVTTPDVVRVQTPGGVLTASKLIDCMGSWSPAPVAPRKGQMLSVKIPEGVDLPCVLRNAEVYIVPRTDGPNAGRAIIGATIEDAGFDLTVHAEDILTLNARAVKLLPALAEAEFLESWSGLRPCTADGLPILGAAPRQPRYVVATGHFRNGILLAPGTARVMAQMLAGEEADIDLTAFSAARF
jgi:glycine oxidase